MLKSPFKGATDALMDTVPMLSPTLTGAAVAPYSGDQYAVIGYMMTGGEYPIVFCDTMDEANKFLQFIQDPPATYTLQ